MNKTNRLFSFITISFVAFGIVTRAWYYYTNRSLFIDEANIARNLFEKNFFQLSGNLDYNQHAPPLFMWILKSIASVWNYSEYALRLFPFICGISTVILFYKLAQRLLKPHSIWLALALISCNILLINYSSEAKQYACDANFTIICLYLFYRPSNLPSRNLLAIMGMVLIWVSMPVIFILCALGIYLLIQVRQRTRQFKEVVIIFICWTLSFLLLYYFNLSSSLHSKELLEFHESYFIQLPFSTQGWNNFNENIIGIFRNVCGKSLIGILSGLLFFSIACFSGNKDSKQKSLLLWGPVLICLIVSGFKHYSLIPRLMAFSLPLIILLIVKGFEICLDFIQNNLKLGKMTKLIFIFLLIGIGLISVVTQDKFPFVNKIFLIEEIKPALLYVKKEATSGSIYFIHNNAVSAFKYYTEIHPDKSAFQLDGIVVLGKWDTDYLTLIKEANISADHKHWFIFSHFYGEDLEKLNNTLHTIRVPKKEIMPIGAIALLY